MPRHVPAQMRGRLVRPTHAPCVRRVIACDAPDASAYSCDGRLLRNGFVTTWLLALAGDRGQRRTDGLTLLGQRAEAVALGVQLLLDEVQHLGGDTRPEQIRAGVRRTEVEADPAEGTRRLAHPA